LAQGGSFPFASPLRPHGRAMWTCLAGRRWGRAGAAEWAPLLLADSRLGGVVAAATKAKKRWKRLGFAPRVPQRFNYQRDGDFPAQARPRDFKPVEIRDLQDAALDGEASGEFDRLPPRAKPHRVREAVRDLLERRKPPAPQFVSELQSGALRRLEDQRLQASKIPELDLERDLGEDKQAAKLAAVRAADKAKALAQRGYKWMPNPFGEKPGPLGTDPKSEAKYYQRYFNGQEAGSQRPTDIGVYAEELKDGKYRAKRTRMSPKQFWIKPDYITPDPANVSLMNSRELKFAMVNEAHLVQKWKDSQPEKRMAGMPPGSGELWMAFGYRAAYLSAGPDPKGLDPNGGGRPIQRFCSLSTTLRFLQSLSSMRTGPYTALCRLASRAIEQDKDLRPVQCFFLLQALARLGLKHPKATKLLERMSLTWPTLRDKDFVKAANAVAKLDIAGGLWAKPLKAELVKALPRISGRQLANLKAIAAMELFDEPAAMRAYLEQCERMRTHFWYPRHLQVVELHVHLLHPELWASLGEHVRLFLQEVRTAAERSSSENVSPAFALRSKWQRWRPAATRSGSSAAKSDGDSSDSEDGTDSDTDTEKDSHPHFDKLAFTSALHSDVSRVLGSVLRIDHQNKLAAGPLTIDICHTPTMTVLEAAEKWQFYLRSPQPTAMARRRHELLRAMGFRLVQVPYHRWSTLPGDDEKAAFLRSQLPSEVLAAASRAEAADA